MANEIFNPIYYPADSQDVGIEYSAFGGNHSWGFTYLGGEHPTWGDCDAALRFRGINIGQGASVSYAKIVYKYSTVGSASSGHWKFNVRGIDEDNCGNFEDNNPFGYSRTSANIAIDDGGPPTSGGAKTIDVRSLVNEIVGRSGWSRNNSLGFVMIDDGSDNDVWAGLDPYHSYFIYRENAEPNFTPTPLTVAAPTFPDAKDWGWKQAYPGYNVFDATEDQLYLTTRKRTHKILTQGTVNTTAGVTYQINHNLNYKPFCLVYVKSNTTSSRFKVPRFFPTGVQTGPDNDTINGYIQITDTQLLIQTTENAEVYYRIFLDEV